SIGLPMSAQDPASPEQTKERALRTRERKQRCDEHAHFDSTPQMKSQRDDKDQREERFCQQIGEKLEKTGLSEKQGNDQPSPFESQILGEFPGLPSDQQTDGETKKSRCFKPQQSWSGKRKRVKRACPDVHKIDRVMPCGASHGKMVSGILFRKSREQED